MNPIRKEILTQANDAAIYTLYLYLADKATPADHSPMHMIVDGLRTAQSRSWPARDRYRLTILHHAVTQRPALANARISHLTRSGNGSTACVFTHPTGDIFVLFKGTGSGEWIDNGEGLSGIPEENIYITYDANGKATIRQTVSSDHASDQQVAALNWFRWVAARSRWDSSSRIILAGHSKGGNKAQFITVHSDLVKVCYSFDGQGFSPEALASFKQQYGNDFNEKQQRIHSFCADNDYVHVLGEPLAPQAQTYYFTSALGIHYLEAILDHNGRFLPRGEQGKLARYIRSVSRELMAMPPSIRQYATLGIMNIFQRYLGRGRPVNNDAVSLEKTIAGIGVAIGPLLRSLE